MYIFFNNCIVLHLYLEIMCMHFILTSHHISSHICNHICQNNFCNNISKNEGGGSKAVWNFSKNSSDLVAGTFPLWPKRAWKLLTFARVYMVTVMNMMVLVVTVETSPSLILYQIGKKLLPQFQLSLFYILQFCVPDCMASNLAITNKFCLIAWLQVQQSQMSFPSLHAAISRWKLRCFASFQFCCFKGG